MLDQAADMTVTAVFTDAQFRWLPRTFDDRSGLTVERVTTASLARQRVLEIARDLRSSSPRFEPFERWAALELAGGRVRLGPPDAIEVFARHGRLPSLPPVLRDVATLAGVQPDAKGTDVPAGGPALRDLVIALSTPDEAGKIGPPGARLRLARAIRVGRRRPQRGRCSTRRLHARGQSSGFPATTRPARRTDCERCSSARRAGGSPRRRSCSTTNIMSWRPQAAYGLARPSCHTCTCTKSSNASRPWSACGNPSPCSRWMTSSRIPTSSVRLLRWTRSSSIAFRSRTLRRGYFGRGPLAAAPSLRETDWRAALATLTSGAVPPASLLATPDPDSICSPRHACAARERQT